MRKIINKYYLKYMFSPYVLVCAYEWYVHLQETRLWGCCSPKLAAASTELLKSKCLKVTCSAAQDMKKCIFFVKVTSIKAKIKLSIRTYPFKSSENITYFFISAWYSCVKLAILKKSYLGRWYLYHCLFLLYHARSLWIS